MRRYLVPREDFGFFLEQVEAAEAGLAPQRPGRIQMVAGRLFGSLARRLPERPSYVVDAIELTQTILTSREFAQSLARLKPYYGLELLRVGPRDVREFLGSYIRALLLEPSTVLHYELLNLSMDQNWYRIDSSKRLLNFFFSDPHVAQEYAIWSPIGEAVIAELDRMGRDRERDPYNLPLDRDFQDNEEWQSPLFAAIYLFDIMVRQALRHGVEWHMWLYYFPDFTTRIVRNYSLDDPLVESEVAMPIRYSRLLYNIFDALKNWIDLLKAVPSDQANIVLRRINLDHENENIPKSAIICTRFCLRDVLPSGKINLRLKRDILHLMLDRYFDLRTAGFDDYAEVLGLAMKPTGFIINEEEILYRNALADGYNSFDKFPHTADRVRELKEMLEVT